MNKILLSCMLVCMSFLASQAQSLDIRQNEGGVAVLEAEGRVQTLPAADFAKLLADTAVQLVDVRTSDEYKSGHIPGAMNMDVRAVGFDKAIGKLDQKRPVAVYCRSGVRSKAAAEKLKQKGFRVFELEKGINAWTGEKSVSDK